MRPRPAPLPTRLTRRRSRAARGVVGAVVVTALAVAVPITAQAAPTGSDRFAVTKEYTGLDTPQLRDITSAPSSFYVDPAAGKIYVAEVNDVAVIDTDNGKFLNRITGTTGNYGSLAFDPIGDALVVLRNVGGNPAITRIDRATETISSTVPFLSGGFDQAGNMTVNSTTGYVYYTSATEGTPELGRTYGTGGLERLSGTGLGANQPAQFAAPAIDERRNVVYTPIPLTSSVSVYENGGDSPRSISVPHEYNSIAFDPTSQRLYASDDIAGSGTLTVIDTSTSPETVSAPVSIPGGAGTVTVDPETGRVLVSSQTDDAPFVNVLGDDGRTVLYTVPVPATINAYYWDGTGAVYGNTIGQSIVRLQAGSSPTITSPAPPATATIGAEYSATVTASGSPQITFRISDGALPDGLSLDPVSGVISGTPTTVGTSTFTISATNAYGTATQSSVIQTFLAPAPTPTDSPTPTASPTPTPSPSGSATAAAGKLAATGSADAMPGTALAGLLLVAAGVAFGLRRLSRTAR